jgi:hypothetical protein
MKGKFWILVCMAVFISGGVSAQFTWPGGAKAAVCFTYDDGLDCHLDVACRNWMSMVIRVHFTVQEVLRA